MPAFELFSIGHSNIPIDRFVALLSEAHVEAVVDVRSTPYSRFFPWFSHHDLQAHLRAAGLAYFAYGETLGGRPGSASLYAVQASIVTASPIMKRWHERPCFSPVSTVCKPIWRSIASA